MTADGLKNRGGNMLEFLVFTGIALGFTLAQFHFDRLRCDITIAEAAKRERERYWAQRFSST